MKIECSINCIKINDVEVVFPTHLNTLTQLLGEPSREEHHLIWNVVWDDLGIYAYYGSWESVSGINLLLSEHHKLKCYPNRFYKGKVLLDNNEINIENFNGIKLNRHAISKRFYKGEDMPYCLFIGKNYDYKEEIPKNKYALQPLNEEVVHFEDFGFKLAIIDELMYSQELLKPKFDIYEFVEWYKKRDIDIEEEGYDPIPEITQYFKDLPIPKRLAKEITKIYQDGGNDVYRNLIPFDGGMDYAGFFEIRTTKDAENFPNLKKITLCYGYDAEEDIVAQFNQLGIQAKWL